jgi:hypothetical protein
MLVMALPNHASDGTAKVMLAVAQCRCRVMLAMTLLGQLGRGVMSLPSHVGVALPR